jgi:two-component system, NtrC family, nitrogen regulation sensor histidine kinase NtrY
MNRIVPVRISVPRRSRFSLAGKLAGIVALDMIAVAGVAAIAARIGFPPRSIFLASLGAGLPLAAWSLSLSWRPVRETLHALADGVRSFQENDFSLRLAGDREDELGDLVALYNQVGDTLRVERNGIYQRELLLDTLLQGAPMAIFLVNELDRVSYANSAARHLFGGARRLQGRAFADVVADAPESAREALAVKRDAVFTWPQEKVSAEPGTEAEQTGEEETYRILHRRFQMNTQESRLIVVERITPELRRQEVEVWKKVIRVLSHELNNSLAPVSSLLHSARHVAARPDASPRLAGIFDAIDERVRHLSDFLDGYARFARLPPPVKRPVEWAELLDSVGRLFPFRLVGELPSEPAFLDAIQMQQVLINLLKNAAEAGGPAEEVALAVRRERDGGWRLEVFDRGNGMHDDAMRKALLPFYSSKQTGSGLGLPLCSEIVQAHGGTLRLERRAGGGIAVICVLPES